MAVIDASVWVAWFNEDDKFLEQAESIFRSIELKQERVCIPPIAFTEVAGAIKRTTKDKGLASAAVYEMKDMNLKVFADFEKLEPIATDIAIQHSIKGADAYYLAVAELTKSKLYTFDKQQEDAFEAISKNW